MWKMSSSLAVAALVVLGGARSAGAVAAIDPAYASEYTLADLGSVTDLPARYGGLTFLPSDANTIIIGGAANGGSGKIYRVGVVRGAGGHITGFSGAATVYSDGVNNDGGVVFGPGGVLFLARWPSNEIGQIKPGSADTKVVGLTALGVASSIGGINFVPTGFPGAGQLKVVSYNTAKWYSLPFTPDGIGTYDFGTAVEEATISGGPEGFIYVPPGSPLFTDYKQILVSEYGAGSVTTYDIDANGDPVPTTRKLFVAGLSGAEGAVIDPVTGDFLFSTFGGGDHVIQVQGFAPPPTTTTTSSTTTSSTTTTSTSNTSSSSSSTSTSTTNTKPLPPPTTTSTLPGPCVLEQLPPASLAGVECAIEIVRSTLDEPPQPQCAAKCRCKLNDPLDRGRRNLALAKTARTANVCKRKLDVARRAVQALATRIKSAGKRSCLVPVDRGGRLASQATDLAARAKALYKSTYCATR